MTLYNNDYDEPGSFTTIGHRCVARFNDEKALHRLNKFFNIFLFFFYKMTFTVKHSYKKHTSINGHFSISK
ncbi:MAG TPA: hypothetical protein VK645_14210, partial [Chitinophagaceae bacterium]|nr:hypothetical protein [Chitinophagaceae bacterium]